VANISPPGPSDRAAGLLLSDCKRQSSNSQLTGEHPTPTLDFFRAISAGECLVVSTVALCGAKPNSELTNAIGLSSAAVVENYYVAHLKIGLRASGLGQVISRADFPKSQIPNIANSSGETPKFLAHPASPAPGWWQGSKALGELEANPQLNCYRWY
jgi:hypothetical protein